MSLNSNDKRRGGSELPPRMREKVQKTSKDPADTICLDKYWIRTTKFLRYLELFNHIFQESPFLMEKCQNEKFSSEILHCLSVRSGHPSARESLSRLINIGDSKGGNRHIVVLALLCIACFEPSDGCFALIERVHDRVFRCQSAQKQAYVLLLQHGACVYEHPIVEHTTFLSDKRVYRVIKTSQQRYKRNPFAAASKMEQIPADQMIISELCGNKKKEYGSYLQKMHSMAEDYLDDHKENAFKSALQEPARFYFELCGNIHHKNHVNVHGLNGYLCLVRGWFGFKLPMIPLVDDGDTFKGCADVWKGLDENAWTVFSDPKNFGKDFEGLKELNQNMLKSSLYGEGSYAGRSFVGANAAAIEKRAKDKDRRLFQYAEKFAYFFSKDFLVKRMFEVLNAETKPEYIGFKASCDALFPLFKTGYNLNEESLSEYLYDEFMTNLDVDKAAHFFWWCGICNDQYEIPYPYNNNVCPICFEEKEDIEQIPHWEGAKGDVSGHKMCSDCTKRYRKDQCPFCNEVTFKEEMLNKIKNLILDVKEKSVEGNPHSLAAILESWQFFEMEYESNPRVIHRVCTMIMKDDDFKNLLHDGVSRKLSWMRDGAGLFFRLYGLSLDGHLEISDSEKALLKDCYGTILASLRTVKSQGHYYGALYTQVMVPFVCAYRSGQEIDNLKNIVKTVGKVVVDLYLEQVEFYPDLKWQIPQRIENLYMDIVTSNVWGGTSEDPVWKAFYANDS